MYRIRYAARSNSGRVTVSDAPIKFKSQSEAWATVRKMMNKDIKPLMMWLVEQKEERHGHSR